MISEKLKEMIEELNSQDLFHFYKKFYPWNSDNDLMTTTISFVECCPRLLDNINSLIDCRVNPFEEYSLKHRIDRDYIFSGRKNKIAKTSDTKETMIQRNIFKNKEYYVNDIGKLIGLEVTIDRTKRGYPVDLISYKINSNDDLEINLIELKKCKIKKSKDSKEILLRCISEIATYSCVFYYALKNDKDKLAYQLTKLINNDLNTNKFDINHVRNAKINKIILAPLSVINELNQEYFAEIYKKLHLDDFKFVSLKYSVDYSFDVNNVGKLFEMEEVSCPTSQEN